MSLGHRHWANTSSIERLSYLSAAVRWLPRTKCRRDMVLIALAVTSLASGGFFAELLKPPPTAAARELRELLVDAVRVRSAPDASRADELIKELAEAKVPFRTELLGASSSVEAIIASSDRDSPLWRACYSSGPTPRWEKNAKVLHYCGYTYHGLANYCHA